jgi:F0F1-type ATP synthase membrane subunit c/vacuolar-type H+-ATPase subunit K
LPRPTLKALLVAGIALAVLMLAAPDAAAQGCAMCGTAVSSAKDPLAKGLFVSIIIMLAIPNLLLASIGGWLYITYRRAALSGERT